MELLSPPSKFAQSFFEFACLQLLLSGLGTSRGAGGSRLGRRRSVGGDLPGGRSSSSGTVLTSLASRAGSTRSRLGSKGSEGRSAGRGRDGARTGLNRGRAERCLGLLRSETELVQGVVVVVAEAAVSIVGSLGIVVTGRRGGSSVSVGSLVLGISACDTSRVLASESDELVALASLRNRDAVLVEPLLNLAVRPALEELVRKALLSGSSLVRSRVVAPVGLLGGDVGVAADGSNELVTRVGLRSGDSALIEPCLQVRGGPLRVEPVTGVGNGLAGLVCRRLVVGADSVEERVASAGARVGNAVVVEECLELRLGPTVEGKL